jgi:hypothetical protein
VEFAGEYITVPSGTRFTIGREGDLAIDDNRFLHRHFLSIEQSAGLWWLVNIGSRLAATVTDTEGRVQAQLAPAPACRSCSGDHGRLQRRPTTYELSVHTAQPAFRETAPERPRRRVDDRRRSLTPSQKLLILALAEPVLRREGTGMSELPSSAAAAQRLGWSITRFNRKLDNVCDKLDRQGVPGLRGGVTSSATNRRVRLVEHAVASRLVVRDDLAMLDDPAAYDRDAADDAPRRKEQG